MPAIAIIIICNIKTQNKKSPFSCADILYNNNIIINNLKRSEMNVWTRRKEQESAVLNQCRCRKGYGVERVDDKIKYFCQVLCMCL